MMLQISEYLMRNARNMGKMNRPFLRYVMNWKKLCFADAHLYMDINP